MDGNRCELQRLDLPLECGRLSGGELNIAYIDFVTEIHRRTQRNYIQRVIDHDKAECATVATRWSYEYWDGERKYGYGGYKYDGRWRQVAEKMARYYGLKSGGRILDVGCGKGHLLYEFTQAVPGIEVVGLDISEYAINHAKEEVRAFLRLGNANSLPFADKSFDFVVSMTTLHNLPIRELFSAIKEIERVGKGHKKYITTESWRNEREKVNLLYWQITCEAFFDTRSWEWIFKQCGYSGDWGFIFFE